MARIGRKEAFTAIWRNDDQEEGRPAKRRQMKSPGQRTISSSSVHFTSRSCQITQESPHLLHAFPQKLSRCWFWNSSIVCLIGYGPVALPFKIAYCHDTNMHTPFSTDHFACSQNICFSDTLFTATISSKLTDTQAHWQTDRQTDRQTCTYTQTQTHTHRHAHTHSPPPPPTRTHARTHARTRSSKCTIKDHIATDAQPVLKTGTITATCVRLKSVKTVPTVNY